jgi:hypothetical protein
MTRTTTRIEETAANRTRLDQAQQAWAEVLALALRRGFFGSAAVEICVQDGTIQHIRRKIEQLDR